MIGDDTNVAHGEAVNYLRVVSPKRNKLSTREELRCARENGVCRVCQHPILLPLDPDYPQKYDKHFGRKIPVGNGKTITLNYGEEFAHTECLYDEDGPTDQLMKRGTV